MRSMRRIIDMFRRGGRLPEGLDRESAPAAVAQCAEGLTAAPAVRLQNVEP